jgi:alpha-glucosidase
VIDEQVSTMARVGAPVTWVVSNHDVIRHRTRYGRADGQARKPAGTVPTDLDLGLARARAMALFMLALPGSAYIYQGEELGLFEVEDLPEEVLADPTWFRTEHKVRGRDGCRVPLPWSGEAAPYGFGPAGSTPWLPQPAAFGALTVQAQSADDASVLSLYRAALKLRKSVAGLGDGPMNWVDADGDNTLAFARGSGFVCVVNTGDEPVTLPEHREVLLASAALAGNTLPANAAAWLAL